MEFRREVKTENNTWEYLHINGILKYEIGLCPHQANTVELKKKKKFETSLVVQLLRLCPSNAGGVGSIPGQRTEIPHAAWHSQKDRKKYGALGQPRGMVWGGRREEGSGWGTYVNLWRIHFDIWQI